MMIHKYLLRSSLAVATAASIYGCTLEPYVITEQELFTRAFVKKFGLIDPKQDWNLAETRDVTVSIAGGTASSVKVYANISGKYYIVADYIDVKGTVKIPFDIPDGTTDIRVDVDGTNYYTKVGGTVKASLGGSRTTLSTSGKTLTGVVNGVQKNFTVTTSETSEYENFNSMQMSPILKNGEWDNYLSLNGNVMRYNNPDGNYMTPAAPGARRDNGFIPEGVNNTNNPGVTQNFKITPKNNKFTIYPMYWQTDLWHELGVYLIDDNGQPIKDASGKILRFPIYKDKEGDNLQVYLKNGQTDNQITLTPREAVMHVGETLEIRATTATGANANITNWHTNYSRATVSAKSASENYVCVVNATSPGTIAVSAVGPGNVIANAVVVIRGPYMETVQKKLEMAPGKTFDVTLAYPTASSYDYEHASKNWTTSNNAVATVDGNGRITAVAAGTANISVSCNGTTSTVEVVVAEPVAVAQNIKIWVSSNDKAPDFLKENYYNETDGTWAPSVMGTDNRSHSFLAALEFSLNYSFDAWWNGLTRQAKIDLVKLVDTSGPAVAVTADGIPDISQYEMDDYALRYSWWNWKNSNTGENWVPEDGLDVVDPDLDPDNGKYGYLSLDRKSWNNISWYMRLKSDYPAVKVTNRDGTSRAGADDDFDYCGFSRDDDPLSETDGRWVSVTNKNESYDAYHPLLCRSKGVNIDLGDFTGDVGMYIRLKDGDFGLTDQNLIEDDGIIYYSQSTLNTHYPGKSNSYACSFKHPVSGRLFFSFEDWANVWDQSDMDLNDLVFLLKEVKEVSNDTDKIEVEKDPYQWLLAVEDLGSTDDFDFNDLVVGITSVSTNRADEAYPTIYDNTDPSSTDYSKVTITALSAGGILKAWLYYRGVRLEPEGVADSGEWHKWFGNNYTQSQMLNTGLRDAAPKSYTWNIQNFSIPDIWNENPNIYVNDVSNQNFKVAVEMLDNTVVENIDKVDRFDVIDGNTVRFVVNGGSGNAPQMFLVPGEWLWPTERTPISDAYEHFQDWVRDSDNKDWWKRPKVGAKLYRR